MKKCSNCGTIADSKFCPNCGNPMPNDDLEEKKNDEPLVDFKATVIDEEPIETKQGIRKGKIIIAVALAVAFIIAIVLGTSYVNDNKEVEFLESMRTFDEEARASTVAAEEQCNLIVSVWNDAIWEQSSEETEKYVSNTSDFNEALDNLFTDEDFITKNESIEASRNVVEECIDKMSDTPKGYEDCYEAVLDYYSTYIDFTDLALYPNGSYESFSQDFSRLDNECAKQYDRVYKELEKIVE